MNVIVRTDLNAVNHIGDNHASRGFQSSIPAMRLNSASSMTVIPN